jgi:hypothetical protein
MLVIAMLNPGTSMTGYVLAPLFDESFCRSVATIIQGLHTQHSFYVLYGRN